MKRVMILLPTLDEAEGLAQILPRIPVKKLSMKGWEIETLVIDGGSEDGTKDIAERFGCNFMLQQGKGKGAAMRLGFLQFLKSNCDALVMFDADGT